MNAAVLPMEALSAHTAWRTGGTCDALVVAHDEAAVIEVLTDCKAIKWKVTPLGTGSRFVVREGGLDGVVLRLGASFVGTEIIEGDRIRVGGATPVPAALAVAARAGLAADPALYAVAGTFGASVLFEDWIVESARLGRSRRASDVAGDAIGPRTKGVVLSAVVQLERVGVEAAEKRFRKAIRKPDPPPMSWFSGARGIRNVLRRASLERVRLRQVAIPVEAPEMLVNLGGGTAQDLQLLQKSALERVRRVRGVKLKAALRWVGNK